MNNSNRRQLTEVGYIQLKHKCMTTEVKGLFAKDEFSVTFLVTPWLQFWPCSIQVSPSSSFLGRLQGSWNALHSSASLPTQQWKSSWMFPLRMSWSSWNAEKRKKRKVDSLELQTWQSWFVAGSSFVGSVIIETWLTNTFWSTVSKRWPSNGNPPLELQPHTDHIPTIYRPHTNHIPTTYQQHIDHIPTTYQPHTNHIPTTYRPHTDHILTTYQLYTNHVPATYWPHIGNIPTT